MNQALDPAFLLTLVLEFAILFPAIVLHEVAHGYAAYLLGDPTAKRAGRLTLNPIAHIDPVGTIILPIVLLVLSSGQFFFGWAKPVPFNPHAFKNERVGMAITGIAGPATNITLAIVAGLLSRLFPVPPGWYPGQITGVNGGTLEVVASVILFFAFANLVLAFFNLVPIPPLDGSRVVQLLLPDPARRAYHAFEQYGFLILIGITWVFPSVFGTYLEFTVFPVFGFITGLW